MKTDADARGTNDDFPTRRAVGLATLAGALAVAASTRGVAADDEHQHHDHGSSGASAHPRQKLIDAALDCVGAGNVCFAHCIGEMSKGDTSLKDCLTAVNAMLPMCNTLVTYAAADAARLKGLATLCIVVCEDCEKACKKHAEHHAVCKRCMESCQACIKECRAVL